MTARPPCPACAAPMLLRKQIASNGLTVDEATRLIDGIHRAADKAAAAQVDEPEPF